MVHSSAVNPISYSAATIQGSRMWESDLTKAFTRLVRRKLSQRDAMKWPLEVAELCDLYISVCTEWLQRTWLNCVCPSLRQQVVVVDFGPPQPATWSYHAADCQPTAPVPLVSLFQSAGTLYLTI